VIARTGRAGVTEVARFFSGPRLKLARQLAGLRKVDLAARIEKTPTAVAAYESGRTRPASRTVAELCVALGVEPSFFLATPATMLAPSIVPHFRSLRSTTQLVRDQATAYGRVVHDVVQVLEHHVEMPARDVPTHVVPADDELTAEPILAAREVRQAWGVEKGPISHLLRLAENHGVIAVFSPPQSATVDAYSFDTPSRPIVLLNPLKNDFYRQRFDLAHEIGHLVMHVDVEPGGRVPEAQAHRFAAELLMPAEEIMDQLPRSLSWPQFLSLKEYWGVSLQALLHRARELGVLREVTYRNAMMRMSKEGWRRQEPGRQPVIEQPSLLPRSLQLLQGAGTEADQIAAEARVPANLFSVVTARQPQQFPAPKREQEADDVESEYSQSSGEVISLFE
jgi:Zn-dependent peptidase ImmA (M78 family)/transcriptional regulator with XRE-family HTH domain